MNGEYSSVQLGLPFILSQIQKIVNYNWKNRKFNRFQSLTSFWSINFRVDFLFSLSQNNDQVHTLHACATINMTTFKGFQGQMC